MNQRMQRVLAAMEKAGLEQMVVADSGAIYYLTEKRIEPGERMLALYLNQNGKHKLVLNELFPLHGDPEGMEVLFYNDTQDPVALLAQYTDPNKALGVDKVWPARFLLPLMERGGASRFCNSSSIIDHIRAVKDADEIEKMRRASQLNDQAMGELQKCVAQGMSEKEAAEELARIYQRLGANGGFSFEPIIGYGAHGADPHYGDHGDNRPQPGQSIVLDMGCKHDGYCSDMTRTVFCGAPTEEQKRVYDIVLEANLRGIAAARPGARYCDVDAAARDYITSKGYGDRFLHRTGHSIGLECHEFGDVSSVNQDVLEPGMIFSVEPGVYLAGDFGVRIEDLVLVTEDGCEVLNRFPKELVQL